jgi:uncharacterized membrane protein YqiK
MGVLFVILFILGLVLAGTLPIVTFVKTEKVKLSTSLPGIGMALFFLSLALSFTTIDAGNVGIVKRFGQATRQLQPGAHFVLPYADTVTPVAVQTRIVKPSEEASSRDLQMVNFEVTFAYHVDSAHATEILTTPELLQLRTIEMMSKNWDGHLPTTMVGGSGALPMLDVLESARKK